MKIRKRFFLIVFTLVAFEITSQIEFQEGYYIDENENKITGLIKNEEWLNSPKYIVFKKGPNDEEVKIFSKQITEFSVTNKNKYRKFRIKIYDDFISNTKKRKLRFKEEEILLNKISEGAVNLYSYRGEAMVETFFIENEKGDFLQLINFKVNINNERNALNSTYKDDLELFLDCKNFNKNSISKLKYKKENLLKLVTNYNLCKNSETLVYETSKKKIELKIIPKIGFSYNNVSTKNTSAKFNENIGGLGYFIGSEFEFSLPFNGRKWSIILEPSYSAFEGEKKNAQFNPRGIKVSDSRFQMGFSLRHYFFLKKNQFYATAKTLVPVSSDKSVEFSSFQDSQKFITSLMFSLGVGYRINNKIFTELNFRLPLNEGAVFNPTNMNYSTLSSILTVGYRIF